MKAQQTRQTLSWLVGFDLESSCVAKGRAEECGRVQSPAVRLLVEREREIEKFGTKSSFKITGEFIVPNSGEILKAELNKKFETRKSCNRFSRKPKRVLKLQTF